MKLLIDENLSWRLCKKLSIFFDEIIHSSELKIIQPANDISIWNYAKINGYTIISKDDDFEKIVLLRNAPPKLIYLKTFNLNTNRLVDLIIEKIDKINEFYNSDKNDIFEIYSN